MEIFGSGTAAVVSPVNKILYEDDIIEIESRGFPLAQRFFDELTGIQVIFSYSFDDEIFFTQETGILIWNCL